MYASTLYKDRNKELKMVLQEKVMQGKRCQRIESRIDESQTTEAWNIVISLKTNKKRIKSLINMEIFEKNYRSVLTESRLEFINPSVMQGYLN